MKLHPLAAVVGITAAVCLADRAEAATSCAFVAEGTRLVLQADCTTDSTILVPDGVTLDGAGHTITGVDPVGGHFVGAVIGNAGASAGVVNLTVTVAALQNICDAGDNRLRGIKFEGASGLISGNTVVDINQGPSGCQEGNGVEVRNFGASAATSVVDISDNVVTGYQKTGIVTNGNVSATIRGNVVDGLGPVGYIARNGIQVGFGAVAAVKKNSVAGNSYTGTSTTSGGILVVGGPGYGGDFVTGTQVQHNTLDGNDVGVYVSQYEADFSAPATATSIKVTNNVIVNNACNNPLYQAGVSDVGNGDKITANRISGIGYAAPCGFAVDADESFTTDPKVHGNK